MARLSHYFLPRLLLQGKHVLFLDGANAADPRLLARLARERGVPFAQFNRQTEIARAFTCFQLTELVARVPRFLEAFPAQILIVTAFPDLYFDEDIRDWDARVAFEQALANLRRWAGGHPLTPNPSLPGRGAGSPIADFRPYSLGRGWSRAAGTGEGNGERQSGDENSAATVLGRAPLAVAVFSAAATFSPSPVRQRFFASTCAAAREVWQFSRGESNRLELTCACRRPQLGAGRGILGAPARVLRP